MSHKKILLSGIQPTGKLHIGNYFGSIRQNIELSNTHETFVMIADLHALSKLHKPEEIRENIINLAIDYLALGLDTKQSTMFVQSSVSAHAELAWIFNCITTMPYLMRAHAFKDAEAKNKEISVGVFDYPLLMAADILLYNADVVPVGNDQKQHVEIARDTAEKFNRLFGGMTANDGDKGSVEGGVFKLPEAYILADVGVVPGTDGQKMSKSYGNTIGIFDTDAEIKAAAMKIPTDSKGVDEPKDPDTCKVFALHKLFATPAELEDLRARYRSENGKGIGYKESKELLAANISRFVTPFREKREKIAADRDAVIEILRIGGEKAREVAGTKMDDVKKAVGMTF